MESLRMRRNSHSTRLFFNELFWLGREGSNLRMAESKSTAGAYRWRGVDEDNVSAAFKNGVLTVTVPKSAEAKNVRRITINRNG